MCDAESEEDLDIGTNSTAVGTFTIERWSELSSRPLYHESSICEMAAYMDMQ